MFAGGLALYSCTGDKSWEKHLLAVMLRDGIPVFHWQEVSDSCQLGAIWVVRRYVRRARF